MRCGARLASARSALAAWPGMCTGTSGRRLLVAAVRAADQLGHGVDFGLVRPDQAGQLAERQLGHPPGDLGGVSRLEPGAGLSRPTRYMRGQVVSASDLAGAVWGPETSPGAALMLRGH